MAAHCVLTSHTAVGGLYAELDSPACADKASIDSNLIFYGLHAGGVRVDSKAPTLWQSDVCRTL